MDYFIPKEPVIFTEEIKKSRFITYLAHTPNLAAAKTFWAEIKTEHKEARHHCWAAVAGSPQDGQQYGFSDDGEPAGTAGKPMLSLLQGSGIGEISAVVVRYYGGVLLGTGGLVKAYGGGVQQALKLVQTELKIAREPFLLRCDYNQVRLIEVLCEQYDVQIERQLFQAEVDFYLQVSSATLNAFERDLTNRFAAKVRLQKL